MNIEDVIKLIDQRNLNDLKKININGVERAYENWYSDKCTEWLFKLCNEPSEELQIAVHGAHIARFEKPRKSYPDGKEGYYKWKKDLQVFHANEVSNILTTLNYSREFIERVKEIILKKNLKIDDEVQTLEDILSLVFLEYQLADLMKDISEDKVIRAIKMTWSKMSEVGQDAAINLQLKEDEWEVIKKAI